MKQVKDIEPKVKTILEAYPEARDSDTILYARICQMVNEIACNLPFAQVLMNRNAYGLPNFETVGRVRRRLQEKYPMLRASKAVDDERYENFKRAIEYATE